MYGDLRSNCSRKRRTKNCGGSHGLANGGYDDDEQSKEINLLPSQVITTDPKNNLQYNALHYLKFIINIFTDFEYFQDQLLTEQGDMIQLRNVITRVQQDVCKQAGATAASCACSHIDTGAFENCGAQLSLNT